MANDWFYSNQGKQQGPVSLEALRQMRASGSLSPSDMVWRNGMSDWARVRDVPELSERQAEPMTPNRLAAPASEFAPIAAPSPIPSAQPSSPQAAPSYGSLVCSPRALEMLRMTRPWVRFISAMMWVIATLVLLLGIGIIAANILMDSPPRQFPLELGFAYLAMALIYMGPALYLHRYAANIARLQAQKSELNLEAALEAQKSFWKLTGIMMLVMLGLYVLIIIALIILSAMR